MSATPFLAVLAAAAALSLRPRLLRAGLVAGLVLVPLATSVRYDLLLDSLDTRVALDALLPRLSALELPVSVDSELLLGTGPWPAGIEPFPPDRDYRAWRDPLMPRQQLEESGAEIHIRPHGPWIYGVLSAEQMQALGFRLYAVVEGSAPGSDFLPDAPQHVLPAVWSAARTGPALEVWVRTERALRALTRRLPAEELETLGL
jgi:hypothetical protein